VQLIAPLVQPSRVNEEQPLLASMMPNLGAGGLLINNKSLAPAIATSAAAVSSVAPATPAATVASGDTVGNGQHALQINLHDASWIEVVNQAGQRLVYGLLPAGSHKTYRSDQPLDVRIGNVQGVQISLDGHELPLNDYQRGNVAHFRITMNGGKVMPEGL
jgi:cytoskeleton protein RodZ